MQQDTKTARQMMRASEDVLSFALSSSIFCSETADSAGGAEGFAKARGFAGVGDDDVGGSELVNSGGDGRAGVMLRGGSDAAVGLGGVNVGIKGSEEVEDGDEGTRSGGGGVGVGVAPLLHVTMGSVSACTVIPVASAMPLADESKIRMASTLLVIGKPFSTRTEISTLTEPAVTSSETSERRTPR